MLRRRAVPLLASIVATACLAACGDGSNGASSLLTRSDPEPPGKNCPTGGVAIRAGVDTNGDDTLEDSEVEQTQYVCNGAPELTRQDPLAPDAQCPAGGTSVSVGVDDNGDGVLEDGEIDQTTVVCNSTDVWVGDFTAADWNDPVAVAALEGAKLVTGSLTIQSSASVSLPALELVNGGLTASGSFDLPALRLIGGGAAISESTATPVSFPALEHVIGDVVVMNAADGFAAPKLVDVGGNLYLHETEPTAVSLPVLATVGGSVDLWLGFAELDVPALTSVGGNFAGGKGVTHVSAPALVTIGGELLFTGDGFDDGDLVSLTLDHLAHVGAGIEIEDPSLITVSLPKLETVGPMSESSVLDPTAMILDSGDTSLDFPALTNAAGVISVSSHGTLTSLTFEQLSDPAAGISITQEPALGNVSASTATTLRSVTITQCGHPTLYFPTLWFLDTLDLEEEDVVSLSGFSKLRSLRNLTIEWVGSLQDLSGLEHLNQIDGDAVIAQDDALTSLAGLDYLEAIDGNLDLGELPLTNLDHLGLLRFVGGSLSLDLPQVPDAALYELSQRVGRPVN